MAKLAGCKLADLSSAQIELFSSAIYMGLQLYLQVSTAGHSGIHSRSSADDHPSSRSQHFLTQEHSFFPSWSPFLVLRLTRREIEVKHANALHGELCVGLKSLCVPQMRIQQ
eukprot:TRINITY_DN63667_c0_g1_i1.p1 TRINITY_DN63667_c0_g1~~TRINITY_DN63667_c0_g1_i1.p1  ORF type:complete len:112 (+),score=3.03 TRINITY_DN63667_c0_g1_i1:38-373(+)